MESKPKVHWRSEEDWLNYEKLVMQFGRLIIGNPSIVAMRALYTVILNVILLQPDVIAAARSVQAYLDDFIKDYSLNNSKK